MKNEEMKKNVFKKRKIINGMKYYELNINRDTYFINIINLPKEELIKFKIYINKSNEIDISLKDNYIIYENQFNLEYFKSQTPFLEEVGIKNIIDLIRFLYTFFQEFKEKIELMNQDKNCINVKLQMFHDKIKINILLYTNKINHKNYKNKDINNIKPPFKRSNSCKNFCVYRKQLKNLNSNQNINNKNKKLEEKANNNNSLSIMDYYISLIQKKIPLLKNLTKDKLFLIYKSSKNKENPNFHKICDDKGPTLIFVDTEENRSFITFNKKSWHSAREGQVENYSWRETNIRDDDISIIDLYSQKKMEIKKKNENVKIISGMSFIQQYSNYGPSYVDGNGLCFKIFNEDKYLNISFITNNNEEYDYIKNNYNLNKNNFLHIKDYEVYSFKKDEKVKK